MLSNISLRFSRGKSSQIGVSIIPGENLGAINVQLRPEDILEIDTAVSNIKVHGGRMNEEQMKVVDQTA